MKKTFYVKSLEADLATHRLVDGKKVLFQSVEQMCDVIDGAESHIDPNTVSFGQAARLACTALSEKYTQTYRPQGIVFQTKLQPDYVAPFDLMVVANVPGENIVADYYSIVAKLKDHYERALIPGYGKFLFKTPEDMLKMVPDPETAWQLVNKFRTEHGLSPIPEKERKLVAYNEVIFYQAVPIKPVALFGDEALVPDLAERAKRLNLPTFRSAEEFYREKLETNKEKSRGFKLK